MSTENIISATKRLSCPRPYQMIVNVSIVSLARWLATLRYSFVEQYSLIIAFLLAVHSFILGITINNFG